MAVHITRSGVGLTVGIIILAGLIVGGLFLVKNQGEQARREEAVKIAEKNLEDKSNEEIALNEGDAEENKDESNAGGETNGSANDETAEVPQTGTETTSGSSEAGVDVNELPRTGAGDAVVAALGLGALTCAGVAYVRSRSLVSELYK